MNTIRMRPNTTIVFPKFVKIISVNCFTNGASYKLFKNNDSPLNFTDVEGNEFLNGWYMKPAFGDGQIFENLWCYSKLNWSGKSFSWECGDDSTFLNVNYEWIQ